MAEKEGGIGVVLTPGAMKGARKRNASCRSNMSKKSCTASNPPFSFSASITIFTG